MFGAFSYSAKWAKSRPTLVNKPNSKNFHIHSIQTRREWIGQKVISRYCPFKPVVQWMVTEKAPVLCLLSTEWALKTSPMLDLLCTEETAREGVGLTGVCPCLTRVVKGRAALFQLWPQASLPPVSLAGIYYRLSLVFPRAWSFFTTSLFCSALGRLNPSCK